ncbi:hypothetical protein ABPG73_022435 [Tetrahymena malaccensis]
MLKCNIDKSINPSLSNSDELALTKFLFTPFKDEKIEITIGLEDKVFVGIQNLNINILPCHPTCLECSGPDENQCTKCSKNNPIDGKCQDCDLYFQDGLCVNKCDESKFLFPYKQKQKICIYSPNCEKFDKGSCIQCKSESKFIFNRGCVATCPMVVEIFNAFYNNLFSDLEVNALNIKTSQFLNQNQLKRVTTQCGNKKVLGGFLANKYNSQIEFEVTSYNCKSVILNFNFIIIDFQKMYLDYFILQLNDVQEDIQLSQYKIYEQSNMCGDNTKEEYIYQYSKIYDIDQTKGEIQKIIVKVINNNKLMRNQNQNQDKINKYPYFGISGLTVFCTYNQLCEENCLDCDYKDQNICLQCKQGFMLNKNQKCIEEVICDSESYLDDSYQCKKCSDELQNCLECDSDKSCQKCSNSFILENEKCVCDQDSYLKNQNECVKCQDSFPNCFQCDQNSCLKCSKNYQLHNNQCFICKNDEQTSNNNECQKCLVENCSICLEQTDKCQECEKGYKLNQEKCEQIQCEQTEFINYQINICEQCISKFENCNQCNQNECQSCNQGYYLNRSTNQCVSNCPKGTFVDDNNQCEPCKQQNCLLCSSNQLCQECENGYELNQQKCEIIKCEQNQFFNQQSNICEQCVNKFENCYECNQSECQSCNQGYYLNKSTNECEPCKQQNCSQCSSSQQCQKCENNYQLHDNQCFLCKNDDAQTQCQKCFVPNCRICQESTDKCEECENGFELNQQKCEQIKCELNQFYNYSKRVCEFCSKIFENCNECNQNECKSCIEKYYLNKSTNQCVISCPKGTFVSDNNQCEPCKQKNCLICNKDKCLQCIAGSYYYKQM